MNDPPLRAHLRAAFARALDARIEARALCDAGWFGPGLIWAVRATELLMRDFLLAPHFMESGCTWQEAMRKGSNILGSSNWTKAFAKIEEWYGPFDEPLTEDGNNAWDYWKGPIISRRGKIVHGNAVPPVSREEAIEVCNFADQIATWFTQRFLTSERHPIGRDFREALAALKESMTAVKSVDPDER